MFSGRFWGSFRLVPGVGKMVSYGRSGGKGPDSPNSCSMKPSFGLGDYDSGLASSHYSCTLSSVLNDDD